METIFDAAHPISALRSSGERWRQVMTVPDLSVGLYRLDKGAEDPQTPHTEDEIYYVMAGRAWLKVGEDDEAGAGAGRSRSRGGYPCSAAMARAWRGEADRAFAWLDKCLDARDSTPVTVKTGPMFDPLHADARWASLLQRMGLPTDPSH